MAKAKKVIPVKGLKNVLSELNKTFGANTIGYIDENSENSTPKTSSGLLMFDLESGGGLPKGGMIEIWGPESSGKTTFAKSIMRAYQKAGLNNIAVIDHEHAWDHGYAEQCRVNMKSVLFSQPEDGEKGMEIIKHLIKTGEMDLIIVDSVAAMQPEKVVLGDIGDNDIGLHAKMMGKGVMQINNIAKKNGTLVVWINQIREKIGVMFGSPEKTTGGNALKFYCLQRIDIRRKEYIKDADGNPAYSKHKVTIKKNKIGVPHRVFEIGMKLGFGFLEQYDILNYAIELEMIKLAGSWYSLFDGTKIAQGEAKAIQFLLDNKEMCDDLEKEIRDQIIGTVKKKDV